jgi:hypothetical protein
MSLKNLITGTVTTAVISVIAGTISASAFAYAGHEHPFQKLPSQHANNQQKADRYCQTKWNEQMSWYGNPKGYLLTGRNRRFGGSIKALNNTSLYFYGGVWHVWAHLNNRDCVANQ